MIVVVDFETTGLLRADLTDPSAQPGITEIGLYLRDGRTLLQRINPELPASLWDDGAIKATGITPEMVKDKPTFYEFFGEFSGYFLGAQVFAGYNCPFDQGVLWWQLLRYGLEKRMPWPPQVLDCMVVAKDYLNMEGKRDVKPPKLGELYRQLFDEQLVGAHNAFVDAMATWRCLEELNRRGMGLF